MPCLTSVPEACPRGRRHRLTAALAVVLVGSALVAGCSGDDEKLPIPSGAATTTTNANVYEQQRADGVTALLDKLSTALAAGDTTTLAGLIDASATPAFRTRLETAAANFGTRPPRTTSTTSTTTRSPAPSPSAGPTQSPVPSSTAPDDSGRRGAGGASRTATPRSTEPNQSAPKQSEPVSSTPARPMPDDSRGSALRPATLRYQLVLSDEAETQAPEAITDKLTDQGSSDVWVAPVELHYALGGARAPGIDEPELVVNEQMVVARYEDDWKVVGDATLIGGNAPATMLWELAGLRVDDVPTAGGTSVIASYPGTADTVERARGLLPGAVRAVE
ncbi:MAG: hypothetical protein WAV90_03640, partial [Gordonia amarae]